MLHEGVSYFDAFPVGETSWSRCARSAGPSDATRASELVSTAMAQEPFFYRSAGALGCHTRIRAGFPRDGHRLVMFLGPLGPTCL